MRRNQPYLPLYVQDFMTDEKLMECSALATGIYIRIMCIMHKSEDYGVILLKQKDKQNESKIKNFACKLVKHLPYSAEIIEQGIAELVEEKVLQIDEDKLIQKRMVADNIISNTRACAGSKGGKQTFAKAENKHFAKEFAQAKSEANTENEIEYDNESENDIDFEIKDVIEDLNTVCNTNYKYSTPKTKELIKTRMKEGFTLEDFKKVHRNMHKAWFCDEKMREFLRPITLYSNKFESYLNKINLHINLSTQEMKNLAAIDSWINDKNQGE
jgi:uncharacterized phage protein (TIGR02220 family)